MVHVAIVGSEIRMMQTVEMATGLQLCSPEELCLQEGTVLTPLHTCCSVTVTWSSLKCFPILFYCARHFSDMERSMAEQQEKKLRAEAEKHV